jgi:hypothetical protein
MFRLALIATFSLAFAAAAEEAKYVKLLHVNTGRVLAVTDDSDDNEARAVVAKDEPANKARQWQLVKDGEYLKIVNRKSGKVLDVNNASKDEDGEIIQWEEKTDDNDNQRWSWEGKGDDRRLKSKDSKLVLDVTAEGKVIQKKPDEKTATQLWKIVEVKD